MEPVQDAPFKNDLKEKYLIRREHNGGAYRQRTGNCHQETPKYSKSKEGKGIRRRCYYTHIRVT